MKAIKTFFVLFFIVLGICFVFLERTRNSFEKKEDPRENSDLKSSKKREFSASIPQALLGKKEKQKKQKEKIKENIKKKEEYIDTETLETKEILEKSSIFSAKSLLPALLELRSRDQKEVSQVLLDEFLEAVEIKKKAALRERIIWFARELSYPELVPLWEDLLYRKTPRFEGELKAIYIDAKERSYVRDIVLDEQISAIKVLSLESRRNENIRNDLKSIVLGKTENEFAKTLDVRKKTFFELRNHNKSFALQLIYELDDKDSLKKIIIETLKREVN